MLKHCYKLRITTSPLDKLLAKFNIERKEELLKGSLTKDAFTVDSRFEWHSVKNLKIVGFSD
jgi:hypothetical protein